MSAEILDTHPLLVEDLNSDITNDDERHGETTDTDLAQPEYTPRKALYLTTPGSRLANRQGRLIVTASDGTELLNAPESLVSSIVCVGSITMTSGAVNFALQNAIPTSFLSHQGRYLGHLSASVSQDASRLRTQLVASADTSFATRMAAQIVDGKIHNMRALLARLSRDHAHPQITATLDRLDDRRVRLQTAISTTEIMGIEGAATADYFACWPLLLPQWTGFTLRRRRPPPDAVNAMLGFGGTLLASMMTGALAAARLHPGIGFLHADKVDRASLALDLMEEFRPLIVDQVIMHLVRKGSITGDHFEQGDTPGSVWLTAPGRRIFIDSFEHRVNQAFRYQPLDRTVTYRRATHLQAQQISLCIRNNRADYVPVRWRT